MLEPTSEKAPLPKRTPSVDENKIFQAGGGYYPGTDLFCRETSCLFARFAGIWNHKVPWDPTKDVCANTEALRPELNKYVEHTKAAIAAGRQPCDIFPIEAPGDLYGQHLDVFTAFVRDILSTINPQAVAELQTLRPASAGYFADNGWLYTYKIPLFVVSTCQLYTKEHGRYSGGTAQKYAIVHLQSLAGVDFRLGRNGGKLRQSNISRFVADGGIIIAIKQPLWAIEMVPKRPTRRPGSLKTRGSMQSRLLGGM